jgi:hypothetical protein
MSERERENHDTMPPGTLDEKALAFASHVAEYDRRRALRGQNSSGMLRILALAHADVAGE